VKPEPAERPSLGPALDFLSLLWRVDHALQRRSKRTALELGLTGPQRLVLCILGRFPGLPAGRLAALLHVHPSTLTGVLQRLERAGVIKRRADPRDGRRALFGLTERGRELDASDPVVSLAVSTVLERRNGEVEAARRLLQELALGLEQDAPAADGATAPAAPASRAQARPR
jgi:DNA-binding MarR family transcriptional regulator